ncbi:hypothetical protein V5O48_004853 [Marasmius crinis-equi]|uniref:DUF4112 domain-containing protein n=1 Tax=Marasmius crinis-equi TaxID=585013 RepID=A0ABR3FNX7_9AGAR
MQFGLDSIIGALIPVVGDIIGLLLGLYQVRLSTLFELKEDVVGLMMLYLIIDASVGFVPVIGDFLDIVFKANLYNLRLLEKELEKDPRYAHVVSLEARVTSVNT